MEHVALEHLGLRYHLMPDIAQEAALRRIAGCCRWVYNKALETCNATYETTGTSPSKFEMIKTIAAWKKGYPFLRDAPAQCLQQAVVDLYDGFDRFHKGQNDRPTWRRYSDAPSFRLPQPDQWRIRNLPGSRKTTRHLFVPKMGMSGSLGPIAFVQHRPLEGKVKNLTISREGGQGGMWFVSFSIERKIKPEVPANRARIEKLIEIGAFGDVGASDADTGVLSIAGVDRNTPLNGSCVTSRGDIFGARVRTPEREERLARLQRAVSHKEEALRRLHGIPPGGSLRLLRQKGVALPNALLKARAKVTAFHGHLARVRKDIGHKASRAIADGSDIVAMEDLDTKAMTAAEATSNPIAKAPTPKSVRKDILDAGWGMIETMLAYKLERAGKTLVRVNPAYTSQTCSACAHVEKTNRQGKAFLCVACGHAMDADLNAALNIRARAIHVLAASIANPTNTMGAATPETTQEETGTVGRTGIAPRSPRKGSAARRKRSSLEKGAAVTKATAATPSGKKPIERSAGSPGL